MSTIWCFLLLLLLDFGVSKNIINNTDEDDLKSVHVKKESPQIGKLKNGSVHESSVDDDDLVSFRTYFKLFRGKVPERLSNVTAEEILPLIPRNLSMYSQIVHSLSDKRCQKHAQYFLDGLRNLTSWAVQMFDASVKVPEGILSGSTYQFGNFDECIDVEVDMIPQDKLRGQYCLATVMLSGLNKKEATSEDSAFIRYSFWDKLREPKTRREFRKDVLHWAFCVPAACSGKDIQTFFSKAMDISSIRGLKLSFDIQENMCQVKRQFQWDQKNIIFGGVVLSFLIIVLIATIYDLVVFRFSSQVQTKPTSILAQCILCFSGFSNLVKLVKYQPSNQNLDCIFGIKALTMLLILLGHAAAFLIGGPSMNSSYKEDAIIKVENGLLLNNPLLVDTFLLIGAFLLTRLLLLELDKRKFVNPLILYGARIIRLTPAYAIVLAFYCTWFYDMDSGPLWKAKVGLEQERCTNAWWANVLYVNNYVNSENLCMFQSWYLAVDTHLFFLAPLIIYPLWKKPKLGEAILVCFTLVSILVPFFATYIKKLDPVLMMYANEITDLSSNSMYRTAYIKTHMRGVSYFIGILLGYLVHKYQTNGTKLSQAKVYFGWIVSAFCSISAMFTVSIFYTKEYDALESATYSALHRVGWCMGIAWAIFICVMNYAEYLNRFLSNQVWVPISRLTYCAYLVNGLVELHTIGTLRHTRYLNNYEVAKETIGHIFFTFLCAIILCLLFEAPILGMQNIVLKKNSPKNSNSTSTESVSRNSEETLSNKTNISAA